MLDKHRGRRLAATLLAVPALTLTSTAPVLASAGAAAETLCGEYASTAVQDGGYIVQNNRWGSRTEQCINVSGTSFTVTTAEHDKATDGAPAGYPSIYAGCHYQNCTTGDDLPLSVAEMGTVTSDWSTTTPQQGTYNVAYDLWFDPDPQQPAQNAAELMIWLDHRGGVQPIGSPVATVTIDGAQWEVWTGNTGWNVISYVRVQPTDEVADLDLTAFSADAVRRGSVGANWYLTSVQAGFEPWIGGAGLATDDFALNVS